MASSNSSDVPRGSLGYSASVINTVGGSWESKNAETAEELRYAIEIDIVRLRHSVGSAELDYHAAIINPDYLVTY